MERLSTTGPVNRWPCRARTAPVQDPRQCKSVPLQCPSPGLGKLLARPATVLQPLLRCGASRLLSRLSNTISSVHLSSSLLIEKSRPVGRLLPASWRSPSVCTHRHHPNRQPLLPSRSTIMTTISKPSARWLAQMSLQMGTWNTWRKSTLPLSFSVHPIQK